ncbi:MAG: two-component system sensor histidine kinase BarA [Glaciecola sp.]|jgi:two-component system sensor histidine kinase BarA
MTNHETMLQQLSIAIDQVSDAVVIISPSNIVLHINKPFLQLFPINNSHALTQKPVSQLIQLISTSLEQNNALNAALICRFINQKLSSKDKLHFEFKNQDGRDLRYQDQLTAQGYRIGTFKDESSIIALHQQFENACDEAEKLSEAKNSFMAAMSHEVKTPLNAIIGMLDLCLKDDYIAKNEYMKRIHKNADKLLALINNVLDFAKFDANKVTLSKVPTNLRELSESVIESFSASAMQSNTELQLFVDPRIPNKLLLDDIRITQVLNNLISNGLKFNNHKQPKLSLNITYDIESQNICCLVKDNGIGISDKQQKYVFAGFEQASIDTHRRFGGSGLGLSICQRISWLMRGSLTVTSKLGVGTTFNFTFPVPKNTVPFNSTNKHLSALILKTNDQLFFESLSQYAPFIGFRAEFSENISQTPAHNELQLLRPSSKLNANDIADIVSAGRTILLRNFDANQNTYKGYERLPFISQTPLRLKELLDKLFEFVPSLNDEVLNTELDTHLVEGVSIFDGITALVVEDNPDNMFVLKRQFKSLAITADFAMKPSDALDFFKDKTYDIVLSDYQMPGMSGAELIKKLRMIEKSKEQAPVQMIIITADKTDSCRDECMSAGCDEVLMKPLTIASLSAVFQKVSNDELNSDYESKSKLSSDGTPLFNLHVLNNILGEVSEVELNEFLLEYEENLKVAFIDIVSAASLNEWLSVGSMAHSLKSSALIIGAKPLSEASSELESSCKKGDINEIIKAWETAKLQIDSLQAALLKRHQ